MRRGRTLIFVILMILILGVVGFLAFNQISKQQAPQSVQPATVEVYIAKQPIPQGASITDDVLGVMSLPPENVMDAMFKVDENSALVGMIAKILIEQGTPIMASMVGDASSAVPITGPEWATSIPPGMTAMSIPASRLSLAAFSIIKGAHVNLTGCFQFVDIDPAFQTILPNGTAPLQAPGFLPDTLAALTLGVGSAGGPQGRAEFDPSFQQPYYLTPNSTDAMQRPRMVCQMLLQDVVVMEVGDFKKSEVAVANPAPVAATPDPASPQPEGQQPLPENPFNIITLIVTPQDSITLTYLMYADAQITMTLRNPSDQARQATEAATLQFLLSQYNIPVPAKLPYSMNINFVAPGFLQVTTPPDVP